MDADSGGLSREQVHKQIDASLERLQTDYVDLYQCHRPDPDTPIEETMEALTEVCEAGKAREIGFSEWTVEQIEAALDVPNTKKFVSSQPQYNMIWRAPEAELIPFCEEHGISQIVWSPLAQGVLTGKYSPGEPPPEDSRAASEEMGAMMDRYRSDELLEAVQRLRPIAEDVGLSMATMALAWVPPPGRTSPSVHHRRLAARAGPPERRGVGRQARPGHARRRSTTRSMASPSPGRSWRTSSRKASRTASRQPRGQRRFGNFYGCVPSAPRRRFCAFHGGDVEGRIRGLAGHQSEERYACLIRSGAWRH